MGEGDSLLDPEAFDLVEHGRVAHVGIAAVDLARGDDSNRKPALLHHPDLDRGGVRTQQDALVEVEGVLHVAGGMVLGHVERLEVVVVVLHFGAGGDLEPQVAEDVLDLLMTWLITWMDPRLSTLPGRVTSMPVAACSDARAVDFSSRACSMKALSLLDRAPMRGRSSALSEPIWRRTAVSLPLRPRYWILRGSTSSGLWIFSRS